MIFLGLALVVVLTAFVVRNMFRPDPVPGCTPYRNPYANEVKRFQKDIDFGALVRHYRQMVSGLDAFSIVVRGLSMVDVSLEWLIEEYSAIPLKDFGWLGLNRKLTLACALGAISPGERESLSAVSKLRNDAAHKMDFKITQSDEQRIVASFKTNVRAFSGLDYDPNRFPVTFAFLLLTIFQMFSLRRHRKNIKLKYVDDETNEEPVLAIAIVRTIDEARRRGIEDDDNAVMEVVCNYMKEFKALRDTTADVASSGNPKALRALRDRIFNQTPLHQWARHVDEALDVYRNATRSSGNPRGIPLVTLTPVQVQWYQEWTGPHPWVTCEWREDSSNEIVAFFWTHGDWDNRGRRIEQTNDVRGFASRVWDFLKPPGA